MIDQASDPGRTSDSGHGPTLPMVPSVPTDDELAEMFETCAEMAKHRSNTGEWPALTDEELARCKAPLT